jgi:hypothetical protein
LSLFVLQWLSQEVWAGVIVPGPALIGLRQSHTREESDLATGHLVTCNCRRERLSSAREHHLASALAEEEVLAAQIVRDAMVLYKTGAVWRLPCFAAPYVIAILGFHIFTSSAGQVNNRADPQVQALKTPNVTPLSADLTLTHTLACL